MYINDEDKDLFEKIFKNKDKYKILVDNDCVSVIDKEELRKFDNDEIDDYDSESFYCFGYELLAELFSYLDIDADYV